MVGLIMFKISFFHFITYSRKKTYLAQLFTCIYYAFHVDFIRSHSFFHTQIFRYSIQSNIQHFYCGLKQWIVQCFKNQMINQFWAYTILMVSFIFLHLTCVIARLYLCLLVHVTFEISLLRKTGFEPHKNVQTHHYSSIIQFLIGIPNISTNFV